jgi:exosortase/archaeosortase family protein
MPRHISSEVAPAPRASMRRFLIRFVVAASALLALYYYPHEPRGLAAALVHGYLSLYAHLAGGAISAFDPSVQVDGNHIHGRMSLEFALSCDGMGVLLLFAAATFAFPASWRARAVGVGVMCASLVVVNLVRIVSLYLIGIYAPATFGFFHVEVWPFAIVVLAAAGFFAWTRSVLRSRGGDVALEA